MQGQDRAMKGDPNWPKGYSLEYNVTLSSKTGIEEEKGIVYLPKRLFLGDWLGIGLFVGDGE